MALVATASAWVLLPESEEEADRPEAEGPRLGRGGVTEVRRLGMSALSMALLLPVLVVVAAAALGTPASPDADAAALLLDAMVLSLFRRREAGLAVEGEVAVWIGGKEWERTRTRWLMDDADDARQQAEARATLIALLLAAAHDFTIP